MTVHVDEIHTDVVPTGGAGPVPTSGGRPEPLGAAEERWREARCRLDWLTSRVRAEAFDD